MKAARFTPNFWYSLLAYALAIAAVIWVHFHNLQIFK